MTKLDQKKFNITIGNTVREYREKYKMTRAELSVKSEVNEKYLGKIERGECSVSCYILKKISNGLNIKIIDILEKI